MSDDGGTPRDPPRGEIQLIKDAWNERKTLPLSLAVAMLCLLSRIVSLLTFVSWVIRRRTRFRGDEDAIVEVYVISWLALLILLYFTFPRGGIWGLVFVAVAMYRLQDLVLSTLDDALQLNRRFKDVDVAAKVIFALINLVQIVFIFAIAYSVLTTSADWVKAPEPFQTFGCIVLSWSGMIPFAVSASAQSQHAQVLTMLESAVAVVILLVALSRFLSFAPKLPEPSRPKPGGTAAAAAQAPTASGK